jgi:hypothetical protein
MMAKLDIKPFSVGFIPLSGFDTKTGTIYLEIKIDREGTIKELQTAYGKALPFAMEIGYVCQDTVKLMLQKASRQEKRLTRIISGEPELEVVEEKVEIKEEKKEEEKAPAAAEGLSALFG